MVFISETTIIECWKELIEINDTNRLSLNKFFGILELLHHLNLEEGEPVKSNFQYTIAAGQLSASLQKKYFFDENNLKTFPSQEFLNVIFPNNWIENVFQVILRSSTIPLKNVVVISLQNEGFEENYKEEELISLFLDRFHLHEAKEIFFSQENSVNIKFHNYRQNKKNVFKSLKRAFQLTDNTRNTIGFDKKLITANPGELTRAPFIQTLYSGQENLKCLLLANFDLLEAYHIGSEASKNNLGISTATDLSIFSHQIIFYGSPGTGKSREIELRTQGYDKSRTTFHPETDYHSFVGSYKPVMNGVHIRYDFVEQAFTKAYCNAWLNPNKPYFLIIEEINRGNCAQIFGDLFQCLDRDDDGFSKYEIDCNKDLANYLKSVFEKSTKIEAVKRYKSIIKTEDFDKIILPSNLYIWATMNTSDQSLFPMDSAFKRRWDWEFIPINYEDANSLNIVIGESIYNWGAFIEKINPKIKELTGSEDKQLGNRFVNPKGGNITFDQFRSKVLFYLWSEVYKDEFGTQNSIFKYEIEANNPVDFQFGELYNDNATDIVKSFLKFNGIEAAR